MSDRDEVIKWLDVCKTSHYAVGIHEDWPCRLCPYHESQYCMKELIFDALSMLKEQEAEIIHLRLALQIAKGEGIKVRKDEE